MKIAVAFLACLAIANANLKPFPHEQMLAYDYFAVVKAGVFEPASFASEFAISAKLYIKHYDEEPHGYYMVLQDIKMGSGVGSIADIEPIVPDRPLSESNIALEQPVVIIYNEVGQITGVSLNPSMPSWASNFLKGIVSMLQMDMPKIKFDEPFKPSSFVTDEMNIYGECCTGYDIYRKKGVDVGENEFIIHKFGSPTSCRNYTVSAYAFEDMKGCLSLAELPVTSAMSQMMEIENQGENIFIKKITAHHEIDNFFWKGNSEVHYIVNDVSISFDKFVDAASIELPQIVPAPPVDITYQKPQMRYAPDAAIDITQKHHISQEKTVEIFKALLSEAATYLQENHVDMAEPDFKHGQTINRIMDVMKFLQFSFLQMIFSEYEAATSNALIKQIFIGMIPHIGTTATWNFAMYLIQNKKISNFEIVEMLSTIALKLREPSFDHVAAIDAIMASKESLDPVVLKSIILCRASLFYKIFKDVEYPENDSVFKAYLDHIYDQIINEPNYDLKIAYLMAYKNVRVGNIIGRLEKIINGDIQISENPISIRLNAIWAIQNSILDVDFTYSVFWPVMTNSYNPLEIRIAAYEALTKYIPCLNHVWKIHWFMKHEKNIHLQHYHYTNMKSLANSVSPRNDKLKNIAIKILRMSEAPIASYPLSASYIVDTMDDVYGYGDMFEASIIRDEQFGNPKVIHLSHTSIKNKFIIKDFEIYMSLQGFEHFSAPLPIRSPKIFEILKKVANDMPANKAPRIELMIVHQGQAVFIHYYSSSSINAVIQDIRGFIAKYRERAQYAKADIFYSTIDEFYTFGPMGLPMKFETRIPQVHWIDFDFEFVSAGQFKIKFDNKIWSHAISSVSIYSVVCNAWHFVGRSTAVDANFGTTVNVDFDFATGSIKVTFPDDDHHPVSGVKIYNKDIVGVIDEHIYDSEASIKNNIEDFSTFIAVTKGNVNKGHFERISDSWSTGLKFTSAVFDCENGRTPAWIRKEWQDIFSKDQINNWNSWAIRGLLAISQQLWKYWISPQPGSCGNIIMIQPSPIYAMKSIEFKFEKHINGSRKDFLIQFKTIPITGENHSRMWELRIAQDWNDQIKQQIYKIKIIRYNQAQWNLEIDIDMEKNYQIIPIDPIHIHAISEIASGKIDIQMKYFIHDIIDIEKMSINFKEEHADDHKQVIEYSKACKNDQNSPVLKGLASIVSKTIACIKDIISHRVPTKYTFDISYDSISKNMISKIMGIQSKILSMITPHIHHKWNTFLLEPVKIIAEFPIDKKSSKISVITPLHSYDIVDLKIMREGILPEITRIHSSIDQIFSDWINSTAWSWPWAPKSRSIMGYLTQYPDWNMCSVYPKITIPYDWRYFSYSIPEDYILIFGDYVQKDFAIFAKLINNKFAMLVHLQDYAVEFIPGDVTQVKINGEIQEKWIDSPEGDSLDGNWPFKIVRIKEQFIIEFKHNSVIVIYTPTGIATVINPIFQGKISGICGHMNGISEIPKAYTLDI